MRFLVDVLGSKSPFGPLRNVSFKSFRNRLRFKTGYFANFSKVSPSRYFFALAKLQNFANPNLPYPGNIHERENFFKNVRKD